MYFRYLIIISPWKKAESQSPKDDLCQVWLKLPHWFWRRRFLNFINIFLLFHHYLPLVKCVALHWYKLNPLHPRKFGWNWPPGFAKEIFFNFINVFSYFVIISPWKRGGVSFEQTWIPFTQGCFLSILVENGQVAQEKKFFWIS